MKRSVFFSLLLITLCGESFGAEQPQRDTAFVIRKVVPESFVMDNATYASGSVFKASQPIGEWGGWEYIYAKGIPSGKPYVFSKKAFNKKKTVISASDFLIHTMASSRGRSQLEFGAQNKERFPLKRLALVVANANYDWEPPLVNTFNDAEKVTGKLLSLGFDVITCYDVSAEEFRTNVELFYRRAEKYDVTLFYYAGHGVQHDGTNYLVPCDVDTQYAMSKNLMISVTDMVKMASASDHNNDMFFLDACRDIIQSWTRSTNVATNQIEAPSGISIMYSTGAGYTASDGENENSPFAKAFLHEVGKPNQALGLTMENIRYMVIKNTRKQGVSKYQDPVYQNRLSNKFIFLVGDEETNMDEPLLHETSQKAAPTKANASQPQSFYIVREQPAK